MNRFLLMLVGLMFVLALLVEAERAHAEKPSPVSAPLPTPTPITPTKGAYGVFGEPKPMNHVRSQEHDTTGFFSRSADTNGAFAIASARPTIEHQAPFPVSSVQYPVSDWPDEASAGETWSVRDSVHGDDRRPAFEWVSARKSDLESAGLGNTHDRELLPRFISAHEGNSQLDEPSPLSYYENYIPEYGIYGNWIEEDFAAVSPYVTDCESQWRPWAVNPTSGATGLFQLLPDEPMLATVEELGYTWEQMKEPGPNTDVAHRWWVKTGRRWGPWLSSYGCWSWQVGW